MPLPKQVRHISLINITPCQRYDVLESSRDYSGFRGGRGYFLLGDDKEDNICFEDRNDVRRLGFEKTLQVQEITCERHIGSHR